MLNEIDEFNQYTGIVNYSAKNKNDSTYLGRFTFDTILKFEGLSRVLTIIARGYIFKNCANVDVDYARRALQAWCSVPDSKKSSPKVHWQYKTNFAEYQSEFPELVDENGVGWFCQHVHQVADFMMNNPDKILKTSLKHCEVIEKNFDNDWRKKIKQCQIPIFAKSTKGAWILRFDDIIADALELGVLQNKEITLTDDEMQYMEQVKPKDVPLEMLTTLVAYYRANKPDDSDWVALPVSNFDAYFGSTTFSRKWLAKMPTEIIERQFSFDVSRYKIIL